MRQSKIENGFIVTNRRFWLMIYCMLEIYISKIHNLKFQNKLDLLQKVGKKGQLCLTLLHRAVVVL